MNAKKLEYLIDRFKKLTPKLYKETLQIAIPFLHLHEKVYIAGEKLITKTSNLNQSELDILTLLYYTNDNNSLTPTQLYDLMIYSSGGMTKLLKKLEEKNLIFRINDETDKRSKLVKITDLGKKIMLEALDQISSLEDAYFSKLDRNEQKVFIRLLLKILKD